MAGNPAETNLLTAPLIRVTLDDATHTILDLPALYEHLVADRIASFEALRPHQRQPLHAFLVQVAVLALVNAGGTSPPATAAEWLDLLRGLTPDFPGDEPWSLVVSDLSKPALLQPPVPEGTLASLKEANLTPDALDMLVTSKNHDLKGQRMSEAQSDDWLYALIALQTTEGFLGAGNYGISRMNGGWASRPMVGVETRGGFGARVRRDITRLIEIRTEILESYIYFPASDGLGLVWLQPWDGLNALLPKQLDPYYVEVCRRIRLVQIDRRLTARRGTSKAARIDFPEGYKGVTGDPWAPVDRTDNSTLTVDGGGFHYRRIAEILTASKFTPSPMQFAAASDGQEGLRLVFTATARGKGETKGYHERSILIPPKIVSAFFSVAAARDQLATLTVERVEQAGICRNKVLKPALLCMFQNAPEKLDFKHPSSNKKADIFIAALDREIDRTFFEDLFEELGTDDHDAKAEKRKEWLRQLRQHAKDILATAEAGSPLSHVRRYQSRAAAKRVLEGSFYKAFAAYFPKPETSSDQSALGANS